MSSCSDVTLFYWTREKKPSIFFTKCFWNIYIFVKTPSKVWDLYASCIRFLKCQYPWGRNSYMLTKYRKFLSCLGAVTYHERLRNYYFKNLNYSGRVTIAKDFSSVKQYQDLLFITSSYCKKTVLEIDWNSPLFWAIATS